MSEVISIIVNDIPILTHKQTTIIQACLNLKYSIYKIDIPRFCFHEKLSIAGNCRMCLVEVAKSVKPVVACAMQVNNNMIIKTNTLLVKKAREGVLEFLLANHPLDCPICDQGGECDLQELSHIFGGDKSRFNEYKRAVTQKFSGPFVKTIMTRCIHCTRCVRFLTEISGINTLGIIGRGLKMEISTYLENQIDSELSGNIIDICPVGALTSRPLANKIRSWELFKKETVDVLDSLSADIRIDFLHTKIMRILPLLNNLVNECWISDLTRFSYDAWTLQRIIFPLYKKKKKENIFKKLKFDYDNNKEKNILNIFYNYYYIVKNILKRKIIFSTLTGSWVDSKTLIISRDFLNIMGSSLIESRTLSNKYLDVDIRNNYITNISNDVFNKLKLCIFLGLNLRLESPLYNIRFRKMKKKIFFISFSNTVNLTYFIKQLGLGFKNFLSFIEGKHFFSNFILNLKNDSILFLLGNSCLRRSDINHIIKLIEYYILNINKKASWGFIQFNIGNITGSELGIIPGITYFNDKSLQKITSLNLKKYFSFFFLIGILDSLKINKKILNYIVYLGHHLNIDKIPNYLDLIIPTLIPFEKLTSYINLEGTVRYSNTIINLTTQTNIKSEWENFFFFINKLVLEENLLKYNKLKVINKNFLNNFDFFFIQNILKKDINKFLYFFKYYINNLLYFSKKNNTNILTLYYKIDNFFNIYKNIYYFYDTKIIFFNFIIKKIILKKKIKKITQNSLNSFFKNNLLTKLFCNKDKICFSFNNFYFIKFWTYILILNSNFLLFLCYFINFNNILITNKFFNFYYFEYVSKNISKYNLKNINIFLNTRIYEITCLFLNKNQYYIINNKLDNNLVLFKYFQPKIMLFNYPLISFIDNFYKSSIISKLSTNMCFGYINNKILFTNFIMIKK